MNACAHRLWRSVDSCGFLVRSRTTESSTCCFLSARTVSAHLHLHLPQQRRHLLAADWGNSSVNQARLPIFFHDLVDAERTIPIATRRPRIVHRVFASDTTRCDSSGFHRGCTLVQRRMSSLTLSLSFSCDALLSTVSSIFCATFLQHVSLAPAFCLRGNFRCVTLRPLRKRELLRARWLQ
jgi:hypothetical protein